MSVGRRKLSNQCGAVGCIRADSMYSSKSPKVFCPVNKKCCKSAAATRDVFYVRRKVDLMKTAKVNAYIYMHIFGKIELLSIHAT